MAVMREIRTRIKSVANTQQITKAMKMVAASKLRRVASATPPLKEFSAALNEMLKSLISSDTKVNNVYVNKRKVKKVLYILVVGDMGLCGMYNTAVTMYMKKLLEEEKRKYEVWVIGKWGTDVIKNLGIDYTKKLECISDVPTMDECMDLTNKLCRKYTDGEYDEIHFVYEEFVNTMIQQPMDLLFLPVEAKKEKSNKLTSKEAASLIKPEPKESGVKQKTVLVEVEKGKNNEEYKQYCFQPNKTTVVNELIDKYLKVTVCTIMMEARSGEHSARMTAMTNATENTEKLMDKLQLMYNRARQEAITTEISEIVGGAAALKK